MPDEREPPGDVGREPGPAADRFLRTFFTDSTLWPVLVVAAGSFTTFLAWGLLLAVLERNLAAAGALLLLAGVTVEQTLRDLRARRRLGIASGSLLALWTLAAVAAVIARRIGAF